MYLFLSSPVGFCSLSSEMEDYLQFVGLNVSKSFTPVCPLKTNT